MPSKEFRRFIKTNMSEQDAFDLEYDLIKHYGRKIDGRHAKIGKVMSLKRWYNNSQVSRMFVPGYELEGFYPGRKRRNTV
jgi:hypothetical protein